MSDIAIRIDNLSKLYHLGAAHQRHDTLRDALVGIFQRAGRSAKAPSARSNDLWALKDVSFEVKRGEVVGIIGRNGAGKSTLLKILSRITEPTSGTAEIHGRVGSLLEVGTGFHPELTGRENIFLNGAILGMHRFEIQRRFDEIVAFAEIERFLDTPVKRYSSGMYVRLAFAVAAHLESDILLVDEVLAVGDANFQKKSLGAMEGAAKSGRAVLFVSHNMPMILRLCPAAILLESGRIASHGPAPDIARLYLSSGASSPAQRVWLDQDKAPGDHVARLHSISILNSQGNVIETVGVQDRFYIEVVYWSLQANLRLTAVIHLYNDEGVCLFASNDWSNAEWWKSHRTVGLVRASCEIPSHLLAEGRFFVLGAVASYNPNIVHAMERDAASFQVVDQTEGDGVRGEYAGGDWPGVVRPLLKWTIVVENQGLSESGINNAN